MPRAGAAFRPDPKGSLLARIRGRVAQEVADGGVYNFQDDVPLRAVVLAVRHSGADPNAVDLLVWDGHVAAAAQAQHPDSVARTQLASLAVPFVASLQIIGYLRRTPRPDHTRPGGGEPDPQWPPPEYFLVYELEIAGPYTELLEPLDNVAVLGPVRTTARAWPYFHAAEPGLGSVRASFAGLAENLRRAIRAQVHPSRSAVHALRPPPGDALAAVQLRQLGRLYPECSAAEVAARASLSSHEPLPVLLRAIPLPTDTLEDPLVLWVDESDNDEPVPHNLGTPPPPRKRLVRPAGFRPPLQHREKADIESVSESEAEEQASDRVFSSTFAGFSDSPRRSSSSAGRLEPDTPQPAWELSSSPPRPTNPVTTADERMENGEGGGPLPAAPTEGSPENAPEPRGESPEQPTSAVTDTAADERHVSAELETLSKAKDPPPTPPRRAKPTLAPFVPAFVQSNKFQRLARAPAARRPSPAVRLVAHPVPPLPRKTRAHSDATLADQARTAGVVDAAPPNAARRAPATPPRASRSSSPATRTTPVSTPRSAPGLQRELGPTVVDAPKGLFDDESGETRTLPDTQSIS